MMQADLTSISWLSLAVWLPVLSGVLVLLLGGDHKATLTRWLALAGSLDLFFQF